MSNALKFNVRVARTVTTPPSRPTGILTPAISQDVVWGYTCNIDASGGSFGAYSASGLPLGSAIDANSGVISGRPLSLGSYPVVVRRGSAQVHSFDIRVTPIAGYPPPVFNMPHIDPTGVASWDTDVSSSSVSGLVSAIQVAADDTGRPKFHRVRWSGGDLIGSQIVSNTINSPNADQATTWIVVDGGGARVPYLRFGYRNANVIWYNWQFIGQANGGPGVLGGNSQPTFFACKIGRRFDLNRNILYGIASADPALKAVVPVVANCTIGGISKAGLLNLAPPHTRAYLVSNVWTDVSDDHLVAYQADASTHVEVYECGNVSSPMTSRGVLHPDHIQTGADVADGYRMDFYTYANLTPKACAGYGGTGYRLGHESGRSGVITLDLIDCLDAAGGGWECLVLGSSQVRVDGYIGAPAPGVHHPGHNVRLARLGLNQTAPGPSVFRNVMIQGIAKYAGWTNATVTLEGSSVLYGATESAILATFVGMKGATRNFEFSAGQTDRSRFVMDELDAFALHPGSLYHRLGDAYEPAVGGWASKFRRDPRSWEFHPVWGPLPAIVPPTISSLFMKQSGFTLNVSHDVIVHYCVDQRNAVPSRVQITHGIERAGRFTADSTTWPDAGYQNVTSTHPFRPQRLRLSAGMRSVSFPSALTAGQTYDLYVWVERESGEYSAVAHDHRLV